MRIFIIHNRYRSMLPSGENQIVFEEAESLKSAGNIVKLYQAESDIFFNKKFRLFNLIKYSLNPIFGFGYLHKIQKEIRLFKPDVVHLHNLYPLIGPRIIRKIKNLNIPLVMTIHNYRLKCSNGVLYRNEHTCTLCLDTLTINSVIYRCYRNSFLQSFLMFITQIIYRNIWKNVNLFFAPTESIKKFLITLNIPGERIVIKPNWKSPNSSEPSKPVPTFLYLGRLEEAKGIKLIIEGWKGAKIKDDKKLVIVGSGPLEEYVKESCMVNDNISFLGRLAPQDVMMTIENSGVILLPSKLREVFPVTLLEAFERGRPVAISSSLDVSKICSNSDSWVIDPEIESWSKFFQCVDLESIISKGLFARIKYLTNYTDQLNLATLESHYKQICNNIS